MFGRSKRKQIKGWALDEQETVGYGGLRDRLGANNKLWFAFLVVIVGLAVIFMVRSGGTPTKPPAEQLEEDPIGVYNDSSHHDFAVGFEKMARNRGVTVKASFVSGKVFKLIAPCDISSDELAFLSRAAATGIWRRFKVSPTIWTYTEDINNPAPRLTATTRWSSEKGDFVVKFERAMGAE